ncbi:hypothetical protein BZG35_08370 [Brevundimonas sp. LM2]|uniref:EDR1-related protein n=1 Tax=Brevundimonas sp. LM2 TaxID=1938605 RepID=UPI0009838C2B|nr:EDR1-related protein [Brevundimonas sp. LM2]AQR61664.1 hypothetical protein BZG35_08370 [Brevundimonas sp. LM2]
MTPDALRQTLLYAQTHRIPETEPLAWGFRDGGRKLALDADGQALSRPNREILVARAPEEDVALARVITEARRAVGPGAPDLDQVDTLATLVDAALAENSINKNHALLIEIAGQQGLAGAEIDLGQLITARTGVCRHRSLLFKVLADAVGLPCALVRGLHRVPDPEPGRPGRRSAHAWNEVVLPDGERLLVDVMDRMIADLSDPIVRPYADAAGTPLYPEGAQSPILSDPQRVGGSAEDKWALEAVRAAPWGPVKGGRGGRGAYVYLDDVSTDQARDLRQALTQLALRHDDHQTSVGAAEGQKRDVLRVRGGAFVRLRRLVRL